jgi:MFS family permease
LIKSTLAGTTFAFTFMEVLDTTVANVALPYIAGGMGVGEDEASWVVTTYLVSNAIILTASPLANLRSGVSKPSVNQQYMSESVGLLRRVGRAVSHLSSHMPSGFQCFRS